MEFAPAADTEFRSVRVAYDAGVGTKRTRRKMHKRWSKLALRASLPKRIRRALVSVVDKLADSTVAAVRVAVADMIGVPLDVKYGWVFDKVFLKLTSAPQKKRRPRKRFVLAVSRQHSKHTGAKVAGCISGSVVAVSREQLEAPVHAARQHCTRGATGWGCTSRPAGALMWGAGMQEAYACMHDSPGIKRAHTFHQC